LSWLEHFPSGSPGVLVANHASYIDGIVMLAALPDGGFSCGRQHRNPVVPLAISGTRFILRDGQWQPRHGAIKITIGAPLSPASDSRDAFTAAVMLRDAALTHIFRYCGEPDIQA